MTGGYVILKDKAMASWKDEDEEDKHNCIPIMLEYECMLMNLTEQSIQLLSVIINVNF